MYVRDYMTSPAITITPDTPVQEAMEIMREHRCRRLPVVDAVGRLAGLVSERDLLHASPSRATSLSMWEMNYLLARLTVQEVMTRAIIITSAETPLLHAARLMLENKVGGLPVIEGKNRVVGVITESDIFRAFIDVLEQKEAGPLVPA